jgi:exopolysaccharide transport family protein
MSSVQSSAGDLDVDIGRLFSSLAEKWARILSVALVVTGLALAFAWLAQPHYKGETRILIETRESVYTRPDSNGENERPILDEEGVLSQVEVIASTDILKQVALKLNLSRLPEFDEAADMSLLSRVLVIAGLQSDPNEIPPEERVLKAFREKLSVYRVEKSRVIVIEMSSEDPKLAAEIPNALADAYLAVQSAAKQQSNSDATAWLEPEIANLSRRVKESEARVANFRAQSDLLLGQDNSVLATQQLSELSTELSRVRANRGAAEATAESVRAVLQSGASLDSLPEVLSSTLIQRLRERQVQLKADIADLSTTLLENHPRIRALRSQLSDLDAQIRNEAENVLKGLAAEARTAQLREKQLIADLNRLKAESARAGEEEVELRALEREANAQRELLESYLTRYREASSRKDGNYLPADARIFSRAIVPSEPYFPKVLPIAGAAFIASLLVMGIATLLQELFSGRAMRPAGSRLRPVDAVVMQGTDRELIDEVNHDEAAVADEREAMPPPPVDVAMPEPVEERVDDVVELVPARPSLGEINIERAAEKLIAGGAMRAIFVSPEGDEAAAAAVLVAREVADAGLRVLLLDLTASGAASRPMLDSISYPGITNLLASEAQFTDVIHQDHYSDCHIMPVGTADPARAMRAADRLPIIMESLTTAYDVVVVECGPADAEGIRRLVADGTEILVSVIEPDAEVAEAAEKLKAGGYSGLTLVTPAGHQPPHPPFPDRSAA